MTMNAAGGVGVISPPPAVTSHWWERHPRWGSVVAFLFGLAIGPGGVALLEWYYAPKCPECGRRMTRTHP
jgi:hypothetical protein